MTVGLLLLGGATVLLVAGAELFAENADSAARRLGLSVLAVGLLLAGAEPEELLTGIIAAAHHHAGLAAGDALGANVTMLTLTVGLAAIVRPLPVGGRVRRYAIGSAVAGVAAVLALAGGGVGRVGGALLVAGYAVLVAVVWWFEREPPAIGELAEAAEAHHDERSTSAGLLLVLVGMGVMAIGGELAVAGATRVVDALDVAETAVGLTLLALATTAELFALAWSAHRRGVTELAVAGVVGSAAYNATMTLGAAALVRPLRVGGLFGAGVLAAALPVVLLVLARRDRLGRSAGVALIAVYAGFAVAAFA